MAGPDQDKPSSASPNQGAEPSSADSNEIKKAAGTVLDARRSAVDNIMAGKPAPYFLVDQPGSARVDAHRGIWWYVTSAAWIVVFVLLCVLFIHEVNKATQQQTRAASQASGEGEVWVCPILGRCGPAGTPGLGRW